MGALIVEYLNALAEYSSLPTDPLFPTTATAVAGGQRYVLMSPLQKDSVTRLLPRFLE